MISASAGLVAEQEAAARAAAAGSQPIPPLRALRARARAWQDGGSTSIGRMQKHAILATWPSGLPRRLTTDATQGRV